MAAELSYQWDGPEDGPVLVLSHALGTSRAMWDPQMPRLSSRLRVLRFDHRGHGASPVPAGPYRIDDFGRDFLGLLDRLQLERVAFCGLSLGGMVGMWLGANAPQRIDRLILCCTAARMPRPEDFATRAARVRQDGLEAIAEQIIGRWFTPAFFKRQPQHVASIRRLLVSTDPNGYASSCEALAAMDLRDQLARIMPPTLVVAADQDQSTPIAQSEEIARRIAGARMTVIEQAAHIANLEQPERVSSVILAEMGVRDQARRRA